MNSYDQLTAVKFMGSIGFQHIELVLVCHNEAIVSAVMNIFGIEAKWGWDNSAEMMLRNVAMI